MKIVLAGLEGEAYSSVATASRIKNGLFSYYHINADKIYPENVFNIFNLNDMEMICDSGLFTFMFGTGKGGNYDIKFMREYTKKYIQIAKTFRINKLTIVESDVHKLLGMKAVYELRKHFEDSGLNVLYVWHREEGLEGLIKMAETYDYIALSVPELRKLFKGREERYQVAVFDLLDRLQKSVKKLPKIHLLGNTVTETIKTRLAYSCDSTSWLSAGRYGTGICYENGNLIQCSIYSKEFSIYESKIKTVYPESFERIKSICITEKQKSYYKNCLCNALAFRQFQDYLNIHYPWINEVQNGQAKNEYHGNPNRKNKTKRMESKRAI